MSNDQYLRSLLEAQNLTADEEAVLRRLRDQIEEQLRLGLQKIQRVYYAGSYAKNTMIREGYDLDLVIYWANDCGFTLEGIFKGVGNVLKKHWTYLNAKTVGWELPFQGGFHVDVVPGRALDNTFRYANLYRNDSGSSLQTSIKIHIDAVKNSGRTDAIRLMKLWRKRKNVPFKKSLALELITIEACARLSNGALENQLATTLRYIHQNILTVRLVDPANTNNIISDEISLADKQVIRSAAQAALNAQYWSQVFNPV